MATTLEVFDLITKQMKQTAAIRNTAAAPPKRRRATRFTAAAPMVKPSPLDQLAVMIEKSGLTVKQIARRSEVEPEQIEQFLLGDADALTPDQMQRIQTVIEVVEEIVSKAKTARRLQAEARNKRKSRARR